jgi:tripartite-type tricarboxylate transporter receptor subunit TctC
MAEQSISLPRRRQVVAGLAAAALQWPAARAQGFPQRPVTLVVPFAPGGAADGLGRVLSRGLGVRWNQPVLVDNKPGAGGELGLAQVARSPADGHTMALGATGAVVINPHLPNAPPLDPLRQLAPIAKFTSQGLLIVANPKTGPRNIAELVARARKDPGSLNVGSAGLNTSHHMAIELISSRAGVKLNHVPYKGSTPAVTDVMAGHLPLAVVDVASAAAFVRNQSVLALAITSAQRYELAPEVPTVAESGIPGYVVSTWLGLFAPAGTPSVLRQRIAQDVQALLADPAVQSQFAMLNSSIDYQDPTNFARFLEADSAKWKALLQSNRVK